MYREWGFCSHPQTGLNTRVVKLFVEPGGIVAMKRVISPLCTAVRCSVSASSGQPHMRGRDGSRMCHARRMNSGKERRQSSASTCRRYGEGSTSLVMDYSVHNLNTSHQIHALCGSP